MADGFTIDGKTYTADDLTFREQRELRGIVRDLAEDPSADIEDMALMDLLPALVFIIVRRDRPDYTLDEALDLKIGDVLNAADDEPAANGNGNGNGASAARAARPTKTPADSGRRS